MATFKKNSRYKGSTVTQIEQENGSFRNYVILRKPLNIPLTPNDSYVRIDDRFQFRADLLSQQLYGTTDFDWVLMEVNGFRSVLDLATGRRIRVPPIDTVTKLIEESNNVN